MSRIMKTLAGTAVFTLGSFALVHAATFTPVSADTTTACTRPGGSATRQQILDYTDCRANELAARMQQNSTSTTTQPAPTSSPTPTQSPTPTTTTTTTTATPTPTPTPTSSPTPTTTTTTSGSFPDASTTGVPSGTTLKAVPGQVTSGTGWNYSNGCVNITVAGTVVSGLDITGCVSITADNVTLQNSRVTVPMTEWIGVGVRHVSGVVIKDCDITSSTNMTGAVGGRAMVKDVYGDAEITVLRSDISRWASGVQMSRGLLQDSYIHDPAYVNGDHTNGFTDNGGRTDGSMTVRHNTVLNPLGQTDAISFFEDFGVIKNVTVDNNLMGGGDYALYAGHNPGGAQTSNVVVTNNHFTARYFPGSGQYGPAVDFDNGPGNVWSGNVWDDGSKAGQTIPAPYN